MSRFVPIALLAFLFAPEGALARDKILSRDEIIAVAKVEMGKHLPWIETAEFKAHRGQGVFGWTVFAFCTSCKDANGKPKREVALIKLDRTGKIIEVEPQE